jgi:hypothetical protein
MSCSIDIFFQIAIHNAENWLGLDEEGGVGGGICEPMLLPRPPAISPVSKSVDKSSTSIDKSPNDKTTDKMTDKTSSKACRSETPDSAVDVHSASADSPSSSSSTTSDFQVREKDRETQR